ncbi:MAG: hypothetical protein R3253_00930 [Longimicrobiales bacterium]|nr:hypothetical protein [Longimicrobiales bacterium]
MTSLALAQQKSKILASLRRLEGRATAGDVVADTGLPADTVREGLKSLLESHRGHLEVSDAGELVYEFDPRLIERGSEPALARVVRKAKQGLQAAFKAWIVVMLVVYFVVFVVLIVAAVVAGQRGDSRGGWGGGRGRGGFDVNPFFWYWIWGPRWRLGRPYYGHRWERTLGKRDRVPFYKKVFAFVFGPDRPRPTQEQLDRAKLRLIRARSGVVSTADLVAHTGSSFDEAEEEMARLLGAYDGEAAVSPDGELVYAFPQLMTTVRGGRRPREPNPAWLRLEPPLELTGNTAGANAVVAGMNGFTLLASATAPWFIFPRLGLGGTAAYVGLVLVPVIFSLLFFMGPLVRMAGVKMENRRRAHRNVRRVLLGHVYRRALDGEEVGVREAHAFVEGKLTDQLVRREAVERVLQELAAELDADVSVRDDGEVRYRFDEIPRQMSAGEAARRRLRLDERAVDRIVFSTADTSEEAAVRDMELFDRELAGADMELDRYLPDVDRVGYEYDFELVEFEEKLERRKSRDAFRGGRPNDSG